MRKRVIAIISALLVVSGASAFTIKDGEGNKVNISPRGIKVEASGGEADTKSDSPLNNEHKIVLEARRSAMNFNEIEVSKAIRLIVEERTTGNIIIRAPQSVMPYVSLKVNNGTLHATLLAGTPVSRRSNVLAEVYVPYNGKIDEITTSSAARVIVKPTISCSELDLEASSASVIDITTAAKEVSIDASGASTIKAEVATDDLDIELSGASVADISGHIKCADIELSGASTLRAENMRTSILEIECSGASKASAIGVQCTANASGASAINVECLQHLNASASGASSITYSGDCEVDIISKTGASSIRKK